jgi:hypothetical protein
MRIQVPTDYSEDNITVTANALFVHFANDLSSFINTFMTTKHGPAWLQNLKVEDVNYRNFNPKDPAALLKDLAKYGSSKLRPALFSKIERGFIKSYLEDLDALLGERNAWLHRQVQETEAELLDLVTTLLRVGKPLSLPIVEDCIAIQTSILAPVVEAPVAPETIQVPSQPDVQAVEDVVQPVQDVSEISTVNVSTEVVEIVTAVTKVVAEPEAISVSEIIQIAGDETSQIGDEVKERLLSHSYVLHLNGDIRDRASDELLVDVNPGSAQSLGAFLISRKPSGGRIRITEDGTLCAFFEEKWGYLAKVKPEDWFPDHLHIGTN